MPGVSAILPHTLAPPPGLKHCRTVLDIGAGVRPMQWYKPERHVCMEPYEPYRDVLREAGFEVIANTAKEGLERMAATGVHVEAIYLLDVIEHMIMDVGRDVLDLAKQVATVQIVVFTPEGFKAQTEDCWGYGGHYWQTHRSGWGESDFPGWQVSRPYELGLFAVWNAA